MNSSSSSPTSGPVAGSKHVMSGAGGHARSPEAVVDAAGLPPSLAGVVLETTRRCRLWKYERVDVARELCAHMVDALASGSSEEVIIKEFGNPAETAALITRAKKRLRPLWWRTWRGCVRAVGAVLLVVVVLYVLAAARYFVRSPNIARNYVAELNAPALATAKDQRAWPVYIQALRAFGPLPKYLTSGSHTSMPGDPHWAEYVAWLESKQDALALVREGAAKPSLGYILSSDIDPEYAATLEMLSPSYKHVAAPENDNPLLIGVLLPHLGEMRKFSRFLSADAVIAADKNDRARFLANITAMFDMADQCLDGQFLIQSMVGFAIFNFAEQTAREYITRDGFLLDADLALLAHRVTAFTDKRLVLDLRNERKHYEDIIQRLYSDDGKGGGHLVKSSQLQKLYQDFGVRPPMTDSLYTALGPVQSVLLPSRSQLHKDLDDFAARALADNALPPWRHDERTADQLYHKIGPAALNQALPFLDSMKSDSDSHLARIFAARDLTATRRDVLLTIIGLEVFRRGHGRYPESLTELVPRYLPALPLDPFDGKPLRYRARLAAGTNVASTDVPTSTNTDTPALDASRSASGPILYSIGVDGMDNSGTPPATSNGRHTASSLTYLKAARTAESLRTLQERNVLEEAKGDWVLWQTPAPLSKLQ